MQEDKAVQHLIINSPYQKPTKYLRYNREITRFELVNKRRPAGYTVASENSDKFDDPGHFIEIPLVNQIRERVDSWRNSGYLGVTNITKDLLEYWKSSDRERGLFFCQLEAIETLIWLTEAPDNEKQGIKINTDGGEFQRLCAKMATGTGKTVVMAMLIAWQVLNKATYPKDNRFSKNILIVAPGLTVKNRLQVLNPSAKVEKNYYYDFDIVPTDMFDKLRQGDIRIINWHMLEWESQEQLNRKRGVDKRGMKSDEAYVRGILGNMSKNMVIINDEAHHAWRVNPEAAGKYVRERDLEDSALEATVWIGGLDRIHKMRNILKCFDFTATPYRPSGKKVKEDEGTLFEWIVSDFGLNDAIESGLVKTPRVVIRDDGTPDSKTMRSKFYHIFKDREVKTDLTRSAEPEMPLPDLVNKAYYFLGLDWLATLKVWKGKSETPPVMITVCNRTETAARIKFSFDRGKIRIPELKDPDKTLHIDSEVLKIAENMSGEVDGGGQKIKKADLLRKIVDTVGQVGEPGEQIQNVISVGMLSEGWDAKTVTHIMGLRSFSSQLLCEQVVGRGLRRTSYEVNKDGLFEPEYVNVFGVPFTFLPHEGIGADEIGMTDGTPPPPPTPKIRVHVDDTKKEYEISWPNILRINHTYSSELKLDIKKVKELELNPEDTPLRAELAQMVEGKPHVTKEMKIIDLSDKDIEKSLTALRKQKLIFEAVRDIRDQMHKTWGGSDEYLVGRLYKIVEEFIDSDKLVIKSKYYRDDLRKRLLILLNLNKIVQHLFGEIKLEDTEKLIPIFDKEIPMKSTSKMITWYTSRPCALSNHSHISHVVYDSGWESAEQFEIDHNDYIESWAKNDHLGFMVNYVYNGVVHKFYPDFLIKMKNKKMLVLEIKGKDDDQNRAKRAALKEWIDAVNSEGKFGNWYSDTSFRPSDIKDILGKYY